MIDFNLKTDSGTINREIDIIKQQIDILFDTRCGEVLGDEGFGTRYEDLLYNLNLSNDGIKREVESDLNKLELFGFIPDVNVYMFEGSERDIALINITLARGGTKIEKNYKII